MVALTRNYESPTIEILGQVEDLTGSGPMWYRGDVGTYACNQSDRRCIDVYDGLCGKDIGEVWCLGHAAHRPLCEPCSYFGL